jgi:hypothetical protein
MANLTKAANWFMVVVVLAIIWNGMGVMAYIMSVTMSAEDFLKLSQAEQDINNATPAWAKGAFAFAVFGGLLGSLLLLLKKSLALPVLIVSFIAILVQMYNAFFIQDSFAVFGPGGTIMPIMVIVIAFLLIWLAKSAKLKNWIG